MAAGYGFDDGQLFEGAPMQALQAILDSLDVAVIGYDGDERTVLANRAAEPLLRPGGRLCQGRPLLDGHHLVRRVLNGDTVRGAEVVTCADGAPERHYLAHGQPVANAGRLAAVVAFHDVTLQRRAAQHLECELQVAGILARSEPPDLIIANAIELIGTMLGWGACEFWTIDVVGQVARRQNQWHPGAGAPLAPGIDQVTEGQGLAGRAWQIAEPVWITDLDADPLTAGQTDWGPLRAALAVPIPSGTAILGVLICYSEHHETPDDMRTGILTGIGAHLGEFLERRRGDQIDAELERSRDEYIALVGHELRTPLASIQSFVDLLRADPGLPVDERQDLLDVVHRRSKDLYRLVAGLLDVAGTRAGHTPLRLRMTDLGAVAHVAADRARAEAPAAVIDVNTDGAALAEIDPDRIRDALDELLNNALTWAPEASSIGVNVHGDEHTGVIAVSNTGPPIAADQHQQIFDLFYRSDTVRHGGVPGTGLGLTLARAIVERHHGSLTVSEPDEATTTFTIRLPRHPPI